MSITQNQVKVINSQNNGYNLGNLRLQIYFMKNYDSAYVDLVNGNAKMVIREFGTKRPTGVAIAFFALANAVARNYEEASSAIERIDPIELNKFTDLEKCYFYETQAILAVHADNSNQTVANLCRRALTFNGSAYFARYHLAMYEARFDPKLAVVQLEILHGNYPTNENVLYTYARMLMTTRKEKEAEKVLAGSPNKFRRALYWLMMNLFSKWVIYTLGFALLIILIYIPLVSWIFYGACLIVCAWLMIYGIRKKDAMIFNFFTSVIIVVSILMLVKFLAFKNY